MALTTNKGQDRQLTRFFSFSGVQTTNGGQGDVKLEKVEVILNFIVVVIKLHFTIK